LDAHQLQISTWVLNIGETCKKKEKVKFSSLLRVIYPLKSNLLYSREGRLFYGDWKLRPKDIKSETSTLHLRSGFKNAANIKSVLIFKKIQNCFFTTWQFLKIYL
jgi:hypothetical protein